MKNEISMKAAIYLRAAEIIERGFAKHSRGRTVTGAYCDPLDEVAVAWCLLGALDKARHEASGADNTWGKYDPLDACKLAKWNNAPDTTQAMVAAKLREEAFA